MGKRVKMQSGETVIEIWDDQVDYLTSKGWSVAVDSPEIETAEEPAINEEDVE